MKHSIFILIIMFFLVDCHKDNPIPDNIDFRQEMRNFVQNISSYAKNIRPDFIIIPQNGVEIISKEGTVDRNYLNAIDGMGQEDLFYGYNTDNQSTPNNVNQHLTGFLDIAKNTGNVTILVTDYCASHDKMDDSYYQNNTKDYISFAANHRELDNIPDYPNPIYHENSNMITHLQDIKNFLYLISPDIEFSNRQELVDAVKNTNYDLVIMDFFFQGTSYTPTQIQELKQKSNGGKRLLISYISIGEAENYRYYWQSDWTIGNPSFIETENPDWQGNYCVRYWDPQWQQIIFGNDNSYLKKILDAGFDGVYLDIIDAYEEFE